MKKWSIYYLKKEGSQKLDNFILSDFMDKKEQINKFDSHKIEKNLFKFPLSNEFREKEKVSGYIYIYKERKEEPYWISDINAISDDGFFCLSTPEYNLKTLILLNINKKIYAISYSYGYTLLNPEYIVSDFGLKIAKNELDISELKKIKNTIIKNTSINTIANSKFPLPIRELYNNTNLNIVNEVMGEFNIDLVLTNGELKSLNIIIWGERSVEVRGNLNMRSDLVPLIKKLSLFYREKDKGKVILKNELKSMSTQDETNLILKRLIPYFKDKYLIYLKNKNEIKNKDIEQLEINLPLSKFNFDNDLPVIKYRINGVFKNRKYIDYLDSDSSDVISQLFRVVSTKINIEDNDFGWDNFYKEILVRTKINYQYINEAGETKEGRLGNLYNSIYFECTYKGKKHVLLHGKWYYLEENIWTLVRDVVNSISGETRGIDFDKFKKEDRDIKNQRSEEEYNKRISELNTNENVFCLDQRDFTSSGLIEKKFADYDINPYSKIEPCDLLKIDEEYTFCHVKTGSKSAQLSHLLIQVKASCDLIKNSSEFIMHINKTLKDITKTNEVSPTLEINPNNKRINIILACIVSKEKKKQLNSNAFPLLFNLNLASLYEDLKERGFYVSLVKIEDDN